MGLTPKTRRHYLENSLAVALPGNNGVGVFRLHTVIGFAADSVPLKMTMFGMVRESKAADRSVRSTRVVVGFY